MKQNFQIQQITFEDLKHCHTQFHSMCELLDETFYQVSFNSTKILPSNKNSQFLENKIVFEDLIFSPKIIYLTKKNQQEHKILWIIKLTEQNNDFLVQAHLNHCRFYFIAKILKNNCPVSVRQKQNLKILIKQFSKKNNLARIDPYKAVFSIQNGQWCLKSPIYYSELKGKQFNNQFHQKAASLLKKINSNFQLLCKISRQKQEQIVSEGKKGRIDQIMKYFSRCTTAPSISIKSDCAEYQSVINRYAASRYDLQDLSEYNNEAIKTTNLYFSNSWIYGIDLSSDDKQKYLQEISLRQKEKIQQEIYVPSYAVAKPKQNKYIFNHCYFLSTAYHERRINMGGNSQIFVLKAQLYEYGSNVNEAQNIIQKSQNLSKYIIKHLVYKKTHQYNRTPQNQQNSSKQVKQKEYFDRQTQIVSYLRAGSCLFLPKYYLNIQSQSQYSRKLFIQYLPGQNLDEHINNNRDTISLLTKIYLILQILQTLRFLTSYGIVHLDLKQNNIIVLKKNLCKIIDFGESYHYKVCGVNHKPKYSLIYASPQVVTSIQGRAFTEKSDVFSLGIMLHNIIFGKHPYFFLNQKSFQKSNYQRSLRNKTFLVPQQTEDFKDKLILKILHQLILKCIDMDESKRPYLDWITLVFKTCFNYLTSQ